MDAVSVVQSRCRATRTRHYRPAAGSVGPIGCARQQGAVRVRIGDSITVLQRFFFFLFFSRATVAIVVEKKIIYIDISPVLAVLFLFLPPVARPNRFIFYSRNNNIVRSRPDDMNTDVTTTRTHGRRVRWWSEARFGRRATDLQKGKYHDFDCTPRRDRT